MNEIFFNYVAPITASIFMVLGIIFMSMVLYDYYKDINRW